MKTPNSPRTLRTFRLAAAGLLIIAGFTACGKDDGAGKTESGGHADASPAANAGGVGPVVKVEIGPLDEGLASRGEEIFSGTCAACHKMDQRYVGPALAGVTTRRTPEWIMNMIVNPVEMTQKDPVAKALLAEYMTQMSVSASQEDARAILEYFRKVDGE